MWTRTFLLLVMCSLFFQLRLQSFASSNDAGATSSGFSTSQVDSLNVDATSTPANEPLSLKAIIMYLLALFLLIYEWAVRTFPTVSTYSILTWIARIIRLIVPDVAKSSSIRPAGAPATFRTRWKQFWKAGPQYDRQLN